MSIYTECLRFVFNENTEHWYTTATTTILQHGRFSYSIGLVLHMWLYQCLSSLHWKIFTEGDDITLSGNEFQLFITLLLKQCFASYFYIIVSLVSDGDLL